MASQTQFWPYRYSVTASFSNFVTASLGRPFSLNEFMQEEISKRKLNPMLNKEDKRILVNVIGYR